MSVLNVKEMERIERERQQILAHLASLKYAGELQPGMAFMRTAESYSPMCPPCTTWHVVETSNGGVQMEEYPQTGLNVPEIDVRDARFFTRVPPLDSAPPSRAFMLRSFLYMRKEDQDALLQEIEKTRK